MTALTRKEKCIFVAKALIAEDPDEYTDKTLEQVTAQVEATDDEFIEFAYDAYRSDLS